MPSQNERVLALLRSRPEGVNTASLQEIPTLDGGAPILRLAARIQQLKDRGFTISSRRQSNGTSTYTLVSEPEVGRVVADPPAGPAPAADAPPSSVGGSPSLGSLFDPEAFVERGGYRDAA